LPGNDDSLRWLALMQHHGAPTRLLDTTLSPYVAEAYRLSRRPHFLGGWGLWDVQVGFRRRCVSAPSGW
jgi:hypothetical protein